MMLKHSIVLLFLFFGRVEAEEVSYDPKDWPKRTLELSAEGTLKDVFDAGIRPYRVPGLEKSVLHFKHVNLKIETPEGVLTPEVPVDYAELRVTPGGLWKLITYSPPMTLETSRTEMGRWLGLIERSEEELEEFLAIVEDDFLRYNDRDFGKAPEGFSGGWWGGNRETYTAWLDKAYNPATPLRICVRVFWLKARPPNERRSFYDRPVPPPDGYESVSMQAPEKWGPDSMADIMKWRGEDIGDGTGPDFKMRPPGWKPGDKETPLDPEAANSVEAEAESKDPSRPILWGLAGVLLLGILALRFKALTRNAGR